MGESSRPIPGRASRYELQGTSYTHDRVVPRQNALKKHLHWSVKYQLRDLGDRSGSSWPGCQLAHNLERMRFGVPEWGSSGKLYSIIFRIDRGVMKV